MSQLDQAKKEAKRLFNLAKANSENPINNNDKNNNYLVIENLSKSREIVSNINGYKNWHEYEEVLKRKDFIVDKVDKNTINKENKEIFNNQKNYIQDIAFNTILNPIINPTKIVIEKEHKPIILGRKIEKTFFEKKEKKWLLNRYPVLWTGSTGAGKTETLLSMAAQYIENKEGVIYFEGKGENALYVKLFSLATQHNRLNDLYCINFMTGSRDLTGYNNNEPETLSHSIDPINPMLGSDEYFTRFFGRFGNIIHAILKELNQKNQLMDTQSLKSILMLNNLLQWYKDKKFTTQEIPDYLVEIGLSLDKENDEEDFNDALLKHAYNAHTAYQTVEIFEQFAYMFKIDCSINMERLFLERKILLVLLPALEKSTFELANLGTLILSQIKYIEEKYQRYKTHFQNIIIDEFIYFADCLKTVHFASSFNNYIFGCYDYERTNEIFNHVLNSANTHVMMKGYANDLHNKFKIDLISNMEELPKLKWKHKHNSFTKNFLEDVKDMREGQAYVLGANYQKNDEDIINNKYKYYCEFVTCEYISPKREKKLWLVKHPKPLIYIKDNTE